MLFRSKKKRVAAKGRGWERKKAGAGLGFGLGFAWLGLGWFGLLSRILKTFIFFCKLIWQLILEKETTVSVKTFLTILTKIK